ncbi:Leucine Rich Repeat (LRR)-containing protein [Thiovulum sp. ES]|nr:Leucine Rich Repeat (LRR)-containing protein [Thiovulum sp. ES]
MLNFKIDVPQKDAKEFSEEVKKFDIFFQEKEDKLIVTGAETKIEGGFFSSDKIYKSEFKNINFERARGGEKLKELENISGVNLKNFHSVTRISPWWKSDISDISGFENFINLTYLNLNTNQVSDISALKNLTNLKELDLTKNQVSDISSLKNLVNLEELYLWENKISDISALKNLTNLKELDLRKNKINFIPKWIGNFINLTYLNLQLNNLSEIPTEIENLTKLESLMLGGNKLTKIPNWIGNLTNLTELYWWEENLKSVSSNIKKLDLTYNSLSKSQKSEIRKLLPNREIKFE